MINKTKKKLSIFSIFAIIFAVIGAACFIYYLYIMIYYVSQGYTLSEVLPSFFDKLVQSILVGGGLSMLLFALNAILEKMPAKEVDVAPDKAVIILPADATEIKEPEEIK